MIIFGSNNMQTFVLIRLRLFSSAGLSHSSLCIEALANHLDCQKRSSDCRLMLIASEREFDSLNLDTCFLFGA